LDWAKAAALDRPAIARAISFFCMYFSWLKNLEMCSLQ
jgi:hypothetical protein